MKIFPLLFCLVLILASGVLAKNDQKSSCPSVDVRSSGVPRPGDTAYFTADVDKKGRELKIEYLWTVRGGEIIEGRGKETIAVKVSGGDTLEATVEIKGFPEGCPNTDTETHAVAVSNSSCPTVDVTGSGTTKIDEPVTFTANVESYDSSKLTFLWTVSSGEIIEGQGTAAIKVLRTNNNETITAAVEVKDLSKGCAASDSETGALCSCARPMLFDEYDILANGDLKARTHNLFVQIGKNPGSQGYLISYGTNREITRREKQIRYVITSLNLDARSITLIRGGANPRGKGVYTKVWIVPPGADNPTPEM